jgi:hypothetical protein
MCTPPSSLRIERWERGGFADVLFPDGNEISINPASSPPGTYDLNWTNGKNNPRSMALAWAPEGTGNSGTLSGSDVGIYDSSSPGTGTEIIPGLTVIVTISESGSSTGYLNPEPPTTDTPTNGVFIAQATPGDSGGDSSCA